MAFVTAKKKGASDFDVVTWDKESQKTIEGIYIEYRTNIGGKPGSNFYVLQDDDGKKWAVWESKILAEYFENYDYGTKVQVTYLGKKKSKTGPASYNDFTVMVDDSVVVEKETKAPFDK